MPFELKIVVGELVTHAGDSCWSLSTFILAIVNVHTDTCAFKPACLMNTTGSTILSGIKQKKKKKNPETSAVLTLQIPADLLMHRHLRAAALGGSCYDC